MSQVVAGQMLSAFVVEMSRGSRSRRSFNLLIFGATGRFPGSLARCRQRIGAADKGKRCSQGTVVQAKYLSDLSVLPGTLAQEIDYGKDRIRVVEADGQGILAAIRIGTEVYIWLVPRRQLSFVCYLVPSKDL